MWYYERIIQLLRKFCYPLSKLLLKSMKYNNIVIKERKYSHINPQEYTLSNHYYKLYYYGGLPLIRQLIYISFKFLSFITLN